MDILYTKPSITDLEISYVNDAVSTGWGKKCYNYINKFESEFAKYIGTKYAISTSSCTGALEMGLRALDFENNDEIILADINWIATVAPVIRTNARPVFVDIKENTWCIDPNKIESSITNKTKAIIATHLYGSLVNIDKLMYICEKYGLYLIEDSAEAIGSIYKGKKAGSMGDFGVFSFHGTKTITTGEGGMFVTNNKEIYERVLNFSNHGRCIGESKQFWSSMIGYKYKMSNMQAALGCAQLERIDELVTRKISIFNMYKEILSSNSLLHLNAELESTRNSYWMPTVVFNKELNLNKDKILSKFVENNIDARVFFYPLTMLPMFNEKRENEVAYDIHNRAINLPSYHDLTYEQICKVCSIVNELSEK